MGRGCFSICQQAPPRAKVKTPIHRDGGGTNRTRPRRDVGRRRARRYKQGVLSACSTTWFRQSSAESAMRIAVVSDTHGHFGSTNAAVRLIARHDVAAVLHCGDIGSTSIIPLFAGWPAHFV